MVFDKGCLPPGYKFLPSNEELIQNYLKPMVLHQLNMESVNWYIFQRDIYQYSNPLLLFQDIQSNGDHHAYFYTPIRKISSKGKNIKRTTGEGKWKSESKPRPIEVVNGTSIGTRRMLTFSWKDKSNEVSKGHWIMHEYILLPEFYRDHNIKTDPEYVICEIYCIRPGTEQQQEPDLSFQQPPKRQRTSPSMDTVPAQYSLANNNGASTSEPEQLQQDLTCRQPAKRQRETPPMDTMPAAQYSLANNNGASTSWASPVSAETRLIGTELSAWAPEPKTVPSISDFEDPMNFIIPLDDMFLAAEDINTSTPPDNSHTYSAVDSSKDALKPGTEQPEEQQPDLSFQQPPKRQRTSPSMDTVPALTNTNVASTSRASPETRFIGRESSTTDEFEDPNLMFSVDDLLLDNSYTYSAVDGKDAQDDLMDLWSCFPSVEQQDDLFNFNYTDLLLEGTNIEDVQQDAASQGNAQDMKPCS